MSTSVRITVNDDDRMIAEGRFEPREAHHFELIEGEVVPMSPIGPEHGEAVEAITEWSYENRPKAQVKVRVQDSLGIPELESVPEPDVAWVRRRSYRRRRPTTADVLLLVEVAVTSPAYDRGTKARVYAKAGVADYWIVNIADECVEVHRDPEAGAYRSVTTFRPGESVPLLAYPALAFPVSALLAEEGDGPSEPEG